MKIFFSGVKLEKVHEWLTCSYPYLATALKSSPFTVASCLPNPDPVRSFGMHVMEIM